ncbi:3-oxoacyl-[acyl-carrier-protein] reductase FabG-like isoform X1 [Sitodiplosis mosellana]|uniref:3-oxoacyl-[acyl-carrier-protein] reductase FabG-like isoform X1 n=1 Tax=Sitodiplosis mosellana TaxID=263140 RepID=UPI0024446EBE|nr:3-oxoacyl-[acyl-carrier-protein] reductase FabG-like isoform X1 [Sitodiplosis mosellana]
MELASKGVRVNSCNPGFVDTDFYTIARGIGTDTEEYNEIVEQNKRKHPLQRIGYPDDCVSAISFLANEEGAKFITGVLLRVDGGISTKGAF